jgi:acetyltransferase-like isoleucine patch superfamily enzyme
MVSDHDGGGRQPLRQVMRLAVAAGWQRYVKTPACSAWTRVQLWCWAAEVAGSVRCSGPVRLAVRGRLKIGRNVRVNSGPANYVGGDRRMAIWVGRDGRCVIGDGCALSNSTIVATESVEILAETFIGGGCNIYDTDFHHVDASGRLANAPAAAPRAAIRIGPRAFVGGHVTVLKGVTIGEGAVVGACSVVTRDVPPGEVWAGVPAKFIRKVEATTTPPQATPPPPTPTTTSSVPASAVAVPQGRP